MFPLKLEDVKDYYPKTPLMRLNDPWLSQYQVEVFIKRDDLIDPKISGNKFRKLKQSLVRYQQQKFSGIVSFGGPWSNHLHALSSLAKGYSIPLVVFIRGEQPVNPSDTLIDIRDSGASLHYLSRTDYRELREWALTKPLAKHSLLADWQDYMIIPEGGNQVDALLGVAEIIEEIREEHSFNQLDCDAIYLPCGTGTTVAGLSCALGEKTTTKIIAIAALKAGQSLEQNIRCLLDLERQNNNDNTTIDVIVDNKANWEINHDFHFGGFAKITPELTEFINNLYQRSGLITEPVYTGKTLFALYQHIKENKFAANSKIIVLHTGGLQGLRGYRGRGYDELLKQTVQ